MKTKPKSDKQKTIHAIKTISRVKAGAPPWSTDPRQGIRDQFKLNSGA